MAVISVGFDVGACALKGVALDSGGAVWRSLGYVSHRKNLELIAEEIFRFLEELLAEKGSEAELRAGFAGALAGPFAAAFGRERQALIECHLAGAGGEAGVILDLGASGARLIEVRRGFPKARTSSRCAAGTGSFLEEQSAQMGFSFPDFVSLAGAARVAAPIGGRCSVFAKSDRVTCGARGYSAEDIALGLHYAVARTFRANLVKQTKLAGRVFLQCKLAEAPALVKALEEVLELEAGQLVVPELAASRMALGCARVIRRGGAGRREGPGVSLDREALLVARQKLVEEKRQREKAERRTRPLHLRNRDHLASPPERLRTGGAPLPAVVGLDIGSRSTCICALSLADERILYTDYLDTAGQPLRVVLGGLRVLQERCGESLAIRAVAATGSSRDFIRQAVGADLAVDEITAQARGARYFARKADKKIAAVFEIGGQDSKFIRLAGDGVIVQFGMNKICSAGTGTFLEEIAGPLGVDYRGEYQERALASEHPSPIGARCTVFMRAEAQAAYQRGESIDDLLAGVALAVASNYLDTFDEARPVVEEIKRELADHYVALQGGTFKNLAVVAAFEQLLRFDHFFVPELPDQTGAVGIALLAKEWLAGQPPDYRTTFDLEAMAKATYRQEGFSCADCANRCHVTRVLVRAGDEEVEICHGDACEKYSRAGAGARRRKTVKPLTEERNRLVFA